MKKSVKSINPFLSGRQECQSPDTFGISVILKMRKIIKAQIRELKVDAKEVGGSEFIIRIPLNQGT